MSKISKIPANVEFAVPTEYDKVFMSNQVSRAAHDLSVMQARVVYLAMSKCHPDSYPMMTVEMRVSDIVRALGLSDGGNIYADVREAFRGAMSKVIDIDTPDGWTMFHWFARAKYMKSRDTIQVKFDDELGPYIVGIKDMFQIFSIADISKLQGRYSMRLYEIAMSWKGMAGKQGNKAGTWYVDLEFDKLRKLFVIGENEYKKKNDYRRRVIDGPVKEINEAKLGIFITCDYQKLRRGRRLDGVRLLCETINRDDPIPVHPATETDREMDELRAQHEADWEKQIADWEAAHPSLFPEMTGLNRIAAEAHADEYLKKTHQNKKIVT